jgi:hypothetical protein
MCKSTVQYKLVEKVDVDVFTSVVTTLLNSGWGCSGDVVISVREGVVVYSQCLLKHSTGEKKNLRYGQDLDTN